MTTPDSPTPATGAHIGEGSCASCGVHGCCDCVAEPKCPACSLAALATPATATAPADIGGEARLTLLRDALAEAYTAGADDVHNEWLKEGVLPRGDPDFAEASSDYAVNATDRLWSNSSVDIERILAPATGGTFAEPRHVEGMIEQQLAAALGREEALRAIIAGGTFADGVEAEDEGPIADAARRIASYSGNKVGVDKTAKRELADIRALQPPTPVIVSDAMIPGPWSDAQTAYATARATQQENPK